MKSNFALLNFAIFILLSVRLACMDMPTSFTLEVEDRENYKKEFKIEREIASISSTLSGLISDHSCDSMQIIPLKIKSLKLFEEIFLRSMKAIHEQKLDTLDQITSTLSLNELACVIGDANYLDIGDLLQCSIDQFAQKLIQKSITNVADACTIFKSFRFPSDLASVIATHILYRSDVDEFFQHLLDTPCGFIGAYGDSTTIFSFCHSPKGLLAVGSIGEVDLLGQSKGNFVQSLKVGTFGTDKITDLQFNKDGSKLAVVSNTGKAIILDAATGTELTKLSGHTNNITTVCFDFTLPLLAARSSDTTVCVWDILSGNCVARYKSEIGDKICFSANSLLAVNSASGNIILYDPTTNKNPKIFKMSENRASNNFRPICSNPDNTLLAAAFENTVQIWDPKTEKCIAKLKLLERAVTSICFSPDGNVLGVTFSSTANCPPTISLWSAKSFKYLGSFHATKSFEHLATREAENSDEYYYIKPDPVTSSAFFDRLSFSPDGKALATHFQNQSRRLWNITNALKAEQLTVEQLLFLAWYAHEALRTKKLPPFCQHHPCYNLFDSIPREQIKSNWSHKSELITTCSPICWLSNLNNKKSLIFLTALFFVAVFICIEYKLISRDLSHSKHGVNPRR